MLLSADYSQVELRILAHLADVPALKESFARGEDIHRRTASEVFGIFPEMVTDEQRRQAKTINFGVIYGMSAFGLAKQLGIGRREAQAFIDAYFARYPGIQAFMDAKHRRGARAAVRDHPARPALRGPRDSQPERRDPRLRRAQRHQLPGAGFGRRHHQGRHGQAFTGGWPRSGWRRKWCCRSTTNWSSRCRRAELDAVRELVRDGMEGAVTLTVPLAVEIGVGRNWREAH